ncbi:redoxin domain-containing protein [Aquimonas sp.]|jgi:sugar lactone lactonase YvrE/peroxiredoxin|uniref:redoxin domain-containing protein n=1 Tax=Aquimonas sp. TaxID=1872588 RepID=UPI0037C0D66C
MPPGARAPEFHSSLEWVNSPPQRLAEMSGRAVLLYFFNVGSAYCQNALEDMRLLQNRFSDGLTVLGVHCPKFDAERDTKLVLKALNRLFVRFPVLHDPDFICWQHYGISAWPSAVLISTDGRIVDSLAGEPLRERLEPLIDRVLQQAGETDSRVYESAASVTRPEPRMPLAFPSGLAASERHLYVADTGHNRILECTLDGRILRQFGSGSSGFIDGGSAEASFLAPRGLALWKDALYVADTGNHALRRISLLDGDVDTLCGTGKAGLRPDGSPADASQAALNAPWSVATAFDKLYISMAGWNQIWEYDLGRRSLAPLVGSGTLGLSDGEALNCHFAQPAGLALAQQTLFVADSGSSAVRGIQLATGKVQTLMGSGLYEFGNVDGPLAQARLQLPLALALDPRAPQLWIADTYNSTLRLLNPIGRELKTLNLGYRLHQPAALAVNRSSLFVANTDAHEVLRVDFDSQLPRRLAIGE